MGENTKAEITFQKSKTEEMLEYVMSNLDRAFTLKEISEKYDYSEKYVGKVIRDQYGIPYGRLLKMFQMREIARELKEEKISVKNAADKYRYTDFPHFARSFKREIGLSPRDFCNSNAAIPEMPLPKEINGHSLFLKYVRMDNFMVYGYPVLVKNGLQTDILEECAYPLEHPCEGFNLDDVRKQLGFWWSEEENELYYVHGYKTNSEYEIPRDAKTFLFPACDYAVFQVERGDTQEDILKTQRMMVYYVMKIWRKLNHKVACSIVYTYEAFDRNYTYLYLPLIQGMPEHKAEERDMRMNRWISYIDEHITEELSLKNIAAYFNYSEQHFRKVFKVFFEMSPAEYIQKSRLYLAAKEIKENDEKDSLSIAKRYHFKTLKSFQKLFVDEFHMDPAEYKKVKIGAVDLDQYYEKNKEKVRITFPYEPDLKMIGAIVHTRSEEEVTKEPDISQLAAYWMQHEYDELKGTGYECTTSGEEDKISLWYSDDNTKGNEYILGPVVDDFKKVPEKFKSVILPAGKYAVFESLQKTDKDNLADTYRMLTRCSFYGWIHEYYFRVNSMKLTFVRYKGGKLYFYVPVYE